MIFGEAPSIEEIMASIAEIGDAANRIPCALACSKHA